MLFLPSLLAVRIRPCRPESSVCRATPLRWCAGYRVAVLAIHVSPLSPGGFQFWYGTPGMSSDRLMLRL